MADSPTHVRVDVDGAVATITLNRPEARNAYSDEMCVQLCDAIEQCQRDQAVLAVVLTGAGASFHAGGDVKAMKARAGMFAGGPAELRQRYLDGIQAVPRRIATFRKPLICAINGPAVGAGLDLACMCDLRVASRSAKLGSTFVKVGLVPGDGGAFFLARTVGFPRALELMLRGRILSAEEAMQIGLVHEVVDDKDLLPRARALADELASLPADALQLTKRAAYESWNSEVHRALELAATYQGVAQNHPDHAARLQS
ncbi:MAG: enoyl-CoA hydratase-related protein [Planctomycetota bacterium]|nr:enoyl-CoA hydratase-related protein [Planctomycetota bacterium]